MLRNLLCNIQCTYAFSILIIYKLYIMDMLPNDLLRKLLMLKLCTYTIMYIDQQYAYIYTYAITHTHIFYIYVLVVIPGMYVCCIQCTLYSMYSVICVVRSYCVYLELLILLVSIIKVIIYELIK